MESPLSRLLRVQRPPDWMFDALGIIQGTNPQQLSTTLIPMVDTIQGGLAQASYLDGEFVGALGATVGPSSLLVPQTFERSEQYGFLLRASVNNPGGIAVTAEVTSYRNPNHPVTLALVSVAAGSRTSWADFGRGMQWLFIPPGHNVLMTLTGFTVTPGSAKFTLVRVPAGTKPW